MSNTHFNTLETEQRFISIITIKTKQLFYKSSQVTDKEKYKNNNIRKYVGK